MKKLAILLVLLISPMIAMAQNPFDKFENEDDVSSVIVTKNMFKLLSTIDFESDDPEVQDYKELVNSLNNIKIFTTDNPSVAKRMNDAVAGYVSGSGSLSELMRVKEDDKNIKFYSKEGKNENYVSELLMHMVGNVDGEKLSVIMSITGDIDLKKISKLTKDLNVPGSEELKNLDKKN